MTEISAVMRAYRDALDRHRIPWADDTYDTERVGGYRLRVERTETILDEHRVSVIWGYQCLPGREPTGVTIGYPNTSRCSTSRSALSRSWPRRATSSPTSSA